MKALNTQIGGDHYKGFKIEPILFAMANELSGTELAVLKYITRKKVDRIEDWKKARHIIDLQIEYWESEQNDSATDASA